MKEKIKLTESELQTVIRESVKSLLREYGEGKEEEVGKAVKRGLKKGKIGPYNAATKEMNKNRWTKDQRSKFQKGLEEEETLEEYTDKEIKRMYGYRPDDYDENEFNEQPTNNVVGESKKPIRLTEKQLKEIIKESVLNILKSKK